MKLSKSEEQLMEIIWSHGKAFMKDLIDSSHDPKPATTTLATMLKRMQDKGFVGYTLYGNSREYYPLVKKDDYFAKHMKGIISNYFGNYSLQFASFFTTKSNMTKAELEDLKKIIEQEIKRKEK